MRIPVSLSLYRLIESSLIYMFIGLLTELASGDSGWLVLYAASIGEVG